MDSGPRATVAMMLPGRIRWATKATMQPGVWHSRTHGRERGDGRGHDASCGATAGLDGPAIEREAKLTSSSESTARPPMACA
jgi:hypothetical protein